MEDVVVPEKWADHGVAGTGKAALASDGLSDAELRQSATSSETKV
jgi:hypothetical protein